MIRVNVQADIEGITRGLRLKAQQVRKATVPALNRTSITVRARAARAIREAGYGIKIGAIKKALAIKRASPSILVTSVDASGRPIPLMAYGARQTRPGVSVAVLHGRKVIRGAFIATMPSGHQGVFVRVGSAADHATGGGKSGGRYRVGFHAGKHGLPIRELFGPSIPSAFINEKVTQSNIATTRERFPIVLRQQLARVLG